MVKQGRPLADRVQRIEARIAKGVEQVAMQIVGAVLRDGVDLSAAACPNSAE